MPGGTDFIQKVVHKRNRDPHKDESTHRMSAKFPILSDLRMSHRDVELGRVSDNRKIFGTDGVRGVANVEPVTAETALKLGRAAAHVFLTSNPRAHPGGTRPKIVLGKDTRLSGYMLENALVAGITSLGVDVLVIGPLPTPGVAYITRSLRADAGIVLSASHNPYQDNGIKFFRHDGYKLDDQIEEKIEQLVFTGEIDSVRPTANNIGRATRIDDALGRYVEFAKQSFARVGRGYHRRAQHAQRNQYQRRLRQHSSGGNSAGG